jgi:hypothetical protein
MLLTRKEAAFIRALFADELAEAAALEEARAVAQEEAQASRRYVLA